MNRVGASRLFDLSRILDVPISFFFDDLPEPLADMQGSGEVPLGARGLKSYEHRSEADEILSRRETLELVRAYYRINEPSVRRRVFDLIKSMGPVEALASTGSPQPL